MIWWQRYGGTQAGRQARWLCSVVREGLLHDGTVELYRVRARAGTGMA